MMWMSSNKMSVVWEVERNDIRWASPILYYHEVLPNISKSRDREGTYTPLSLKKYPLVGNSPHLALS